MKTFGELKEGTVFEFRDPGAPFLGKCVKTGKWKCAGVNGGIAYVDESVKVEETEEKKEGKKLSELILGTLQNLHGLEIEEMPTEVMAARKEISARYSELKRKMSFSDAAETAAHEWLEKVLGETREEEKEKKEYALSPIFKE